ncbi:hypothetical protein DLAC_07682 [Tieghemostelium lacteum]|uniref:3-beta hydroxysteroid dehydrogenase/isomerase domain-containing protein n=1 Tax=Tieghemostelium lacteum TaxID=361077 RepID=A0A151ZA66_TIELA|nr:hypothetical protein DLAC_07682 [Tieghemostelium lacteum]|eukprot:KYQ90813.1 hypothetical protein DLAC_07682 [Tieghemostelium lacteum]
MEPNNKKIFLTGGSGFLGKYLIEKFLGSGYHVRALSRSKESSNIITEIGAEAVQCNLFDLEELSKAISGCEIVVHCAAKLETNANSVGELFRDNVEGSENLYNQCKKEGSSVRVFIFISSEGVIMNGKDITDADENIAISDLKELGYYNQSKAISEQYILNQSKKSEVSKQMKSIIIRLPLVWGHGDNVLEYLCNLGNTLRWFWIGGGNNQLSICHAENAAHGILLAIEKAENSEIFFLTDGKSVQYRQFFTDRFIAKGVSKWKLHMSIPIWMAWITVFLMAIVWKLFKLRGLPLLTKTGLIYSSKNFTVSDEKARSLLNYQNVIDYKQGMKQIKDENIKK